MKNEPDIYYRYPGTKPFNAYETSLFKGRDEDITRLYELVSVQNLVVLYGRSGLGKSSLLNAGLTRKLKDDAAAAMEEGSAGIEENASSAEAISIVTTSTIFIRFGAYYTGNKIGPFEKLREIVMEEYQPGIENFLFQKLLPKEQTTTHKLWYLFKSLQIKSSNTRTFILVFDQFEELFTYSEKEINIFKKELSELFFVKMPQELRNLLKDKLISNKDYLSKDEAELLFAPMNIKIIFSIRSDKLSLLNKLNDSFPAILKSCYELKPLDAKQASQAIVIPASLTDKPYAANTYTFKEDALNVILDSLTGSKKTDDLYAGDKEGIEAFQLQIVCKYVEDLVIKNSWEAISKENLGNIKDIFENHYGDIIKRLPSKDQLPARKLIEEKLIINRSRICMPVAFLTKDEQEDGINADLINELINTHILRPEHNNTVEISHDTLIEPILKSREKRIAERQGKRFFLFKVIAGSLLAIFAIIAAFLFFNYKTLQLPVDLTYVKDSLTAQVKATVLDSIVDRKNADSLANLNKADSILKALLVDAKYKLTTGIEVQYRCYNEKDADDNLMAFIKNLGYTNTRWAKSRKESRYKPNAIFYGSRVPLHDLKIIALALLKEGYKLQRVADVPSPNIIQIWISEYNINVPSLTIDEIANADRPAALYRGSQIE